MTISETNIELVFRRQDFEEIFFKDDKGNLLKDSDVKSLLMPVVVFGTISSVLAYFYINTLQWIVPILSIVPFAIALYRYIKYAIELLKWRKSVHHYLDEVAKAKKNALTLTNKSFCLTHGDTVYLIQWSVFTKATITDEFIALYTDERYFFPRKSMTASEFEFFKDFVSYKIKHNSDE
jgi:hypothetical protein